MSAGLGEGEVEEEITRQWRELHDEELYDQYSSSNIIREMVLRRMR
jgi:hypothetical protein